MVEMSLRVLLLGLLLVVFFQYQVHPSSAYSFQNNLNPTLLDQTPNFDVTPTALQASDGTLWVAWDTSAFAHNTIPGMFYHNRICSAPAQNLTSAPLSAEATHP